MPKKRPDLDALIEAMVTGDRTVEYDIKCFGAKAVPALVRAMDDPRACAATRWEPAVLRIWEMIVFHATPETVARMAAFVDNDDPKIRRDLYGKLVWYGSAACADALGRAWGARGDGDRDCILNYLRRDARHSRGRWEPGFADAVYEMISGRLSGGDLGPFHSVAETLLRVDPARALAFLTSPETFHAGHPEILGVLIALESEGAVVPAVPLLAMMPGLRAWSDAADEGGRPGAPYEVALSLLARSDPKAARPLVEEALRSGDEFRRRYAGEAMAVIECVDDALAVVQAAVADLDGDGDEGMADLDLLDDAHAHYFLAHEADEKIRNEGLNGYLLETPDAYVSRAPEALEAVGAARAAESVRQARSLFKRLRPRKGGASALDAIYRPGVVARVAELQSPFLEPEPGHDIPTLLRLYALRHPDQFRKKRKGKRRR